MNATYAHRLGIDVGNSRIKLGLFAVPASRTPGELPICVERAVVLANEAVPWKLLEHWRSQVTDWKTAAIAGSNPQGVKRIRSAWRPLLGEVARHITNTDEFPLDIRVTEARRVGIDRLLNAVAVNELRDPNIPAIVVDSGTATTVDAIASDGSFLGGAILPGLAMSAKALHEYTALLPFVSVAELGEATAEATGRDTRTAIRSGLFWGQLGAVKELIERQAVGDTAVFVTGGGGGLLTKFLPHARFEPHLPLQGLVLAAEHLERRCLVP